MFTAIACFTISVIAGYAKWRADRDREQYDREPTNDPGIHILSLHTRQDMQLVVYLLTAILVMLGIIADRLH